MNWYKLANKTDKIKRWIKQNPDDGIKVWTKGNNIFLSIGDWADRELVEELEHLLGQDVEWDYEIGSPGFNWVEIQ